MNEPVVPPESANPLVPTAEAAARAGAGLPPAPPPAEPLAPTAAAAAAAEPPRWLGPAVVLLGVAVVLVAGLAWESRQRVHVLEQELVKRQDASQDQAAEARAWARQAQDAARDAVARVAVLEAKVAESTLQRGQLEDLIQSLSRSRDENVLADTEAAIRVAVQQSAITGSAEPLVAALRQADERLARVNEPRLEGVRRAVARDLDRVRAAGVVDISSVTIRLDEVVRMIDELPLLSTATLRPAREDAPAGVASASAPASAPSPDAAAAPSSIDLPGWLHTVAEAYRMAAAHVAAEFRALVRVTRIAQPEAALLAPEQAFFLRENLKLRLLNARLALLSRQFDLAQADLRSVAAAYDRYFDRSSRRVVAGGELLRQVASQVRAVNMPRPDDTLAALAAASSGR